jgi:hypothetical protein
VGWLARLARSVRGLAGLGDGPMGPSLAPKWCSQPTPGPTNQTRPWSSNLPHVVPNNGSIEIRPTPSGNCRAAVLLFHAPTPFSCIQILSSPVFLLSLSKPSTTAATKSSVRGAVERAMSAHGAMEWRAAKHFCGNFSSCHR